jgi:hypothetical protein
MIKEEALIPDHLNVAILIYEIKKTANKFKK